MAKDRNGRTRRAISTWSQDEGDPGSLNERVKLQRVGGESRAPSGSVVPAWADLHTVWAKVEELGGNESQQAQQTQSGATHRVRIRYYAGLSTRDRLLWDGRTLEIRGITNPDGVKEFLLLACEESFGETPARGY